MVLENSHVGGSMGVSDKPNARLRVVAAWKFREARSKQIEVEPPKLTLSAHQQNTALSYLQLILKREENHAEHRQLAAERSAPFSTKTYNIVAE